MTHPPACTPRKRVKPCTSRKKAAVHAFGLQDIIETLRVTSETLHAPQATTATRQRDNETQRIRRTSALRTVVVRSNTMFSSFVYDTNDLLLLLKRLSY